LKRGANAVVMGYNPLRFAEVDWGSDEDSDACESPAFCGGSGAFFVRLRREAGRVADDRGAARDGGGAAGE
jgi:hypothetical protein